MVHQLIGYITIFFFSQFILLHLLNFKKIYIETIISYQQKKKKNDREIKISVKAENTIIYESKTLKLEKNHTDQKVLLGEKLLQSHTIFLLPTPIT